MAAHDGILHGSPTLKGNVRDVEPVRILEQLEREERHGAETGRAIARFAGILPYVVDELVQRLPRACRLADEDADVRHGNPDRRKVRDRKSTRLNSSHL